MIYNILKETNNSLTEELRKIKQLNENVEIKNTNLKEELENWKLKNKNISVKKLVNIIYWYHV